MHVHPVKLALPLADDQQIDIMIIQWRTPIESGEITPAAVGESDASKMQILDQLRDWVLREKNQTGRPLFILAPEISTPLNAIAEFERLLPALRRPAVVIAGLEYLEPSVYRGLISNSRNPEEEVWIEDVDQAQKVNAAIVLTHGANGAVDMYVQPKIRPADAERLWHVYGAEHVLLFHHENHAPGAGVNFCVQICSDFCSAPHVSQLRKEIAEKFNTEDFRLDLTLLLECNSIQNMPQFRDAANAYFSPSQRGEVGTERGCFGDG